MDKKDVLKELIAKRVPMLRLIDINLVNAEKVLMDVLTNNFDEVSTGIISNKKKDVYMDAQDSILVNKIIPSVLTVSTFMDVNAEDELTITMGRLGRITAVGRRKSFADITEVNQYISAMIRHLNGLNQGLHVLFNGSESEDDAIPVSDTYVISLIPIVNRDQAMETMAKLISNIPVGFRSKWIRSNAEKDETIAEAIAKTTAVPSDVIRDAVYNTNVARNKDSKPNHTIILLQQEGTQDIIRGIPTIITTKDENTYVQEYTMDAIKDEKNKDKVFYIRKSVYADLETTSMVTPISNEYTFKRIAGYKFIKDFVYQRAKLLKKEKELRKHNISLKGIFMLGVPGTGKSTIARCIGNELDVPAYELHIESAFDKFFGATESKIISTLELLERLGRVAVVIDEIDKLFAGVATGMTGNDVPIRVFGILLKHMAREDTNIMFITTANDMNLPSSFTRKGRFDKIFFIDVPGPEDRESIVRYYVDKFNMKKDITDEKIKYLVHSTKSWTGGDIESLIKEIAIEKVVNEKVKIDDIIENVLDNTKMSIREDEVNKMRDIGRKYADNEIYEL